MTRLAVDLPPGCPRLHEPAPQLRPGWRASWLAVHSPKFRHCGTDSSGPRSSTTERQSRPMWPHHVSKVVIRIGSGPSSCAVHQLMQPSRSTSRGKQSNQSRSAKTSLQVRFVEAAFSCERRSWYLVEGAVRDLSCSPCACERNRAIPIFKLDRPRARYNGRKQATGVTESTRMCHHDIVASLWSTSPEWCRFAGVRDGVDVTGL